MGLEIINILKKEKGLTSLELSKQSSVPLGTLNKILNGTTQDPKLDTLKAIAKVLGCSLDDFNDDDINLEKKSHIKTGKEQGIYITSDEEIYRLAAHGIGHDEKLSEEELARIKMAIRIALDKHNI